MSGALSLARAHDRLPEGRSRYVVWGENTDAEMCLGSVLVRPTAAYVGVGTEGMYPPEWQLGVGLLWLRLERQLGWLLPLVVLMVGGTGLALWRRRRKIASKVLQTGR